MRIAITGIGIVSALGVGKEMNREKLLARQSGVVASQILGTCHKEYPVGEVGLTNRQLAFLTQQNPDDELSRNILLGMMAAREAVEDAGLSGELVRGAVLVNGTTVGGMDVSERFAADWQRGDMSRIELIQQHEAGISSHCISHYLGGMKEAITVSTACSSALNALITGANMMRIGAAERVLVGGTEALTKFHLNGFASLGILSKLVCRPFQEERDGINLGEGAAYLMLEKEDEALRRGAHIYGYVSGYANRCDAFHQTASSPEGEGAVLAMNRALEMAGLEPSQIEYINAHGTATPNNDASEYRAFERVFLRSKNDGIPPFESTKNLTGHTTSASGSIEAVFCLMLMQERGYRHVMTNAFGFGGNDSTLILSAQPSDLPLLASIRNIAVTDPIRVEGEVDYKPYIPAMQARRMTPQMRRLVVAAKQALEQAGIEQPDAIVVGTQWGGMQPSATLLNNLVTEGEDAMSPSLFMQSTHNTPASTLALMLGCHGYNTTFSCGTASLAEAQADAALQLMLGEARNVLVCGFDEEATPWQEYLQAAGIAAHNQAVATVLTAVQ